MHSTSISPLVNALARRTFRGSFTVEGAESFQHSIEPAQNSTDQRYIYV